MLVCTCSQDLASALSLCFGACRQLCIAPAVGTVYRFTMASQVRTVIHNVLTHKTHVALFLCLVYIAWPGLRWLFWDFPSQSDTLGHIWGHSYWFRQTLVYSATARFAWHVQEYIISASIAVYRAMKQIVCICSRRRAYERVEAALRESGHKTVLWAEHGHETPAVWVQCPVETQWVTPSDTVQCDQFGRVWRRAASASRGSAFIAEYESTPPPSRHPTPQQD